VRIQLSIWDGYPPGGSVIILCCNNGPVIPVYFASAVTKTAKGYECLTTVVNITFVVLFTKLDAVLPTDVQIRFTVTLQNEVCNILFEVDGSFCLPMETRFVENLIVILGVTE
jgi:hypothetical protein